MAYQSDLTIVVNDPLTFGLSPGLILAVVVRKLALPPFLGLRGLLRVMLELSLRPLACLLIFPARARAEHTQPRRRLNLIGTLVRHHDRNSQRPRCEWRDGDFLHQLLKLERRRRQNAGQNARQPGDLSVKLPRPGCGVHLPAVLIRAQRLTLISRVGANRSTLCPLMLQLLGAPGSLLRLILALLAALRLRPGSEHAAIPTSRHRSSRRNNTITIKWRFRSLPFGDTLRRQRTRGRRRPSFMGPAISAPSLNVVVDSTMIQARAVSIPHGAFEDLVVVPGDVDHVHRWLVWPGDEQGLADERVHGHACLVPGYVEAGYADAAVFGDA